MYRRAAKCRHGRSWPQDRHAAVVEGSGLGQGGERGRHNEVSSAPGRGTDPLRSDAMGSAQMQRWAVRAGQCGRPCEGSSGADAADAPAAQTQQTCWGLQRLGRGTEPDADGGRQDGTPAQRTWAEGRGTVVMEGIRLGRSWLQVAWGAGGAEGFSDGRGDARRCADDAPSG